MDINDAKIRANELKIRIKDLSDEKEMLEKKNSKLKKIAIASAILAFFSLFSHHIVTIIFLILEIAVVLPIGVICHDNEDKIAKNAETIATDNKEIIMLENYIEKLANEQFSPSPKNKSAAKEHTNNVSNRKR